MQRNGACKALLVSPSFSPGSFWNYGATCDVVGRKYSAAPLGLITVAALLPADWELRLVDRNTGELTDADLAWADVVMTGGMLPQQLDTHRIMELAHARGLPVVVGGPDATSSPGMYADADFLVLGEAEALMTKFAEDWRAGAKSGRYQATEFPDLATSPVPRFDLLDLKQYMHVGVQFSRGCPFTCEFCNVIELNGRKPRNKTPEQMLRELDALVALGWRGHVDFVDDNLIGNKRAAEPFLEALASWVEKNRRPFEFTTEASINLADDEALLAAMKKANFFAIFVGIETPDTDTLTQTGKKQNTRRDIADSIARINRAGIFVNAGFIIGFDGEQGRVADAMIRCIEDTAIPVCMVGLLYALPNTRLATRLQAEGRLHADFESQGAADADQCTSGLNFTTLRPLREALEDYQQVIQRIYTPEAFFGRVRRTARELDLRGHSVRLPLKMVLGDLKSFGRIVWRLGIKDAAVRRHFWGAFFDTLLHNPRAIKVTASFAALYLHFGPFSRFLCAQLDEKIAAAPAPGQDLQEAS